MSTKRDYIYSGFRFESEMLPFLIKALSNIFNYNCHLACASEYIKGYRQIDLMAASISNESNAWSKWFPLASTLRKFPYPRIEELAIIAKNKMITPRALAKKTWSNYEITKQHLLEYAQCGLVKKVNMQSYEATDWAKESPFYTASIEAKLKDWSTALDQALYNKPAVDFSYVALPLSEFRCRSAVLSRFKEKGIGIIGVTKNGQYELLVQPRRSPINPIEYMMMTIKIASELPLSKKWKRV